jgi:hypothetical protein
MTEDTMASVEEKERKKERKKKAIADEQRVDEAGMESFPASDPPASNAGPIDRTPPTPVVPNQEAG